MIEQGVKDFTAASYVGILAPAGTPAEVVKALEAALIKALNDKGTQEKFLATGAELVPDELMTSKGFGDYIKTRIRTGARSRQARRADAGVSAGAVARMKPTGPARSGRPDDRLSEMRGQRWTIIMVPRITLRSIRATWAQQS